MPRCWVRVTRCAHPQLGLAAALHTRLQGPLSELIEEVGSVAELEALLAATPGLQVRLPGAAGHSRSHVFFSPVAARGCRASASERGG